jgi:hypothetical protein
VLTERNPQLGSVAGIKDFQREIELHSIGHITEPHVAGSTLAAELEHLLQQAQLSAQARQRRLSSTIIGLASGMFAIGFLFGWLRFFDIIPTAVGPTYVY